MPLIFYLSLDLGTQAIIYVDAIYISWYWDTVNNLSEHRQIALTLDLRDLGVQWEKYMYM